MIPIGRHVSKLSGYAPALPTPFDDDGNVDCASFEQFCDRQIQEGATGLVVCGTTGEAPGAVALAWLLSNPAVTAPAITGRRLEHLDMALRAVEIKLTPEILARLNEIFPGPNRASEKYRMN